MPSTYSLHVFMWRTCWQIDTSLYQLPNLAANVVDRIVLFTHQKIMRFVDKIMKNRSEISPVTVLCVYLNVKNILILSTLLLRINLRLQRSTMLPNVMLTLYVNKMKIVVCQNIVIINLSMFSRIQNITGHSLLEPSYFNQMEIFNFAPNLGYQFH